MNLLLDTHAFLWFVEDNPKLSARALELIRDGNNQVFLSMASLWEMAIKLSVGKLQFATSFETFITSQLKANKIALLGITVRHLAAVASLPYHHRDPFDRLLVAQTMVEQIGLVSSDTALDAYPVDRLW